MTNPTKLELLKTAILVEWIKGNRNAPHFVGSFFFGHYDEEGIAQSEDFASPEEIEEALRSLESEQVVTGYHHDLANSRWFLNEEAALKFHTEHIHDPKSLLHRVERLGRGWVVEILENIRNTERKTSDPKRKPSIGVVKSYPTFDDVPDFDSLADVDKLSEVERLSDIGAPASDRIVSLNHNSNDYKESVSSLEKVIREFREDHHLDNELGHEKSALLKALEGGRDLLNDTTINIRIGVALLIEPLRRVAQKYDQALVGALATTALAVIMKLLGLS